MNIERVDDMDDSPPNTQSAIFIIIIIVHVHTDNEKMKKKEEDC